MKKWEKSTSSSPWGRVWEKIKKINKEKYMRKRKRHPSVNNVQIAGPATPGGAGGGMSPPPAHIFAHQKEKRETKEQEKVSNQKLLKSCHQGLNVSFSHYRA